MPTVAIIVVFQVLRRAGNFAVARPTREVLFTVIPREDKYKAKSFIDTVVYRAGDQIGAWSYGLLSFLGLGMTGIAIAAIPISVAWLLNSFWLGRKQEAMATAQVSPSVTRTVTGLKILAVRRTRPSCGRSTSSSRRLYAYLGLGGRLRKAGVVAAIDDDDASGHVASGI